VVVEAPATRLSVMFLALLAGLDAQIGDGFAGTLRASVEGETARLELEASLENGAAGEIMTPSLARRVMGELGGEIESRAEGSRVVSVVRLPAGTGASEVAGA
jgi:hypothetical protein